MFKESGTGPGESNLILGLNQMQLDEENQLEEENERSREKVIPTDKINLIHPNEVLKALKTFVTIHHKSKKYD